MSETFNEGLVLFAVGMITVFTILGLVVLTGKMIIRIVNHFTPDKPLISDVTHSRDANISKHIAAIVTTVDIVTQGKGRIKNIKKID